MNLKERNYAGDHMVVGSLKVLGNIDGGGVKEIRRDVDLIQKQAEQIAKTQNQYWRDLSDDGIISPVEKQMLLKEWRNIQYSQSAIYTQARSLGYDDSNPIIQTYLAAYNALYEYLYVTLKLFDDMEEDTPIASRDTFNDKFNTYYYAESFVLIALSKGILDTVNIRSLQSLNESGTEGEIGIYKSGLYQYSNGAWVAVITGNYKGARNSLPATVENDFFLASDNFTVMDGLYINGEQLYINNQELNLLLLYKKGYIYYCKDGCWYQESDKANYRYVAAFADVLNITGELPVIFQQALDNLEASLTDAIDDVADTVNNLDLHKPVYLGVSSALPQNPGNGDYFLYSGETTGDFWRRSDIYRWTNGAWEHLWPTLSQYGSYYMAALEDILALNETSSGYFTSIFTQSFFSNSAVIDKLSTRTLELKNPGIIKSEIYTENTQGFCIKSDGEADFSGNTHIGGNCNMDGSITISGACHIGEDAEFRGDIISGPLILKNEPAPGRVYIECEPYTIGGFEIIDRLKQNDVPKMYFKDESRHIEGYFPYGMFIRWDDEAYEGALVWDKLVEYNNFGYLYLYTTLLPGASPQHYDTVYKRYSSLLNFRHYLKAQAYIKEGTKTMRILDLPDQPPSYRGGIYTLGDGILRVSL